jgi:hypothetical protein
MKKSIVLLCSLALLMILVFALPEAAMAYTGAGTAADPYQISSEADLRHLASDVNGGIDYSGTYFEMTGNIALTSAWTPIGTYAHKFKGNFGGGSYTVSGISITATADYQGLFGYADGATLSNLIVSGSVTTTKGGSGGLAAFCSGSTIENCTSTVSVTVTESHSGGLIGSCNGCTVKNCAADCTVTGYGKIGALIGCCSNNTEVSECHSSGTVNCSYHTGFGATFGGLVGLFSNSVCSDCYSTAKVEAAADGIRAAGGLIGGSEYSTITCCYATGDVLLMDGSKTYTNTIDAGGFIGRSGGSTLNKCYATGKVESVNRAGGFLGRDIDYAGGDFSTFMNCYARGATYVTTGIAGGFAGELQSLSKVSNCYSAGAVTGSTSYIGGFVGNPEGASFASSYFDQTIAGREAAGVDGTTGSAVYTGVTPLTTENMQGTDTLTSSLKMILLAAGDGEGEWLANENDYPTLTKGSPKSHSSSNTPASTVSAVYDPPTMGDPSAPMWILCAAAAASLGCLCLMLRRRKLRV